MSKKRLYLIDATAFCYRAFYALSSLSTSFGQPTNAVYGFVNILNKILKEKKPDYLGVCFDVSRDTFRKKKFAEYKVQRPAMPEGLSGQIPLIKEIVSAYGISIFEKAGYEADDIIATIAKKAKEMGLSTIIVSSDKDILQLVEGDTVVFSPYKDSGTTYDEGMVLKRYGVNPRQIPDILALMGDAVDNIPGVPGIGEKTAVDLIKRFGSLDGLISGAGDIEKDKLREAVLNNLETIRRNAELVNLEKGIELDIDIDSLKIGAPDYKELTRVFRHLEFKKFLKDLPAEPGDPHLEKVMLLRDDDLQGLIKQGDELVLYGTAASDVVFCLKENLFRMDSLGPNIKSALASPEIKKTGHDLKKIKVAFAKEGCVIKGLYFDTMVASHLLNPVKSGSDLVDVSWDYLEKATVGGKIDNAKGVELIRKLEPLLHKELCDKSLDKLFHGTEMPLVEVLADMELCGIKLDPSVLKKLSGDLEKQLVKLIEDIYALSGAQFNINSPKQLRDILFDRLKLPIVKRSKTGPSTDEEVLNRLAQEHKLPALLLEYRKLMKLKNTYVDTLPQLVDTATGRIHTSFNQTATETGRLSSTNPNLQNIPIKTEIGSQIRRSIIAADNKHCLLSCDYSQIELRILAHISKDEKLTAAFREDKDIHKATASLIYSLPEDEVTDQMREVAKRINFGIIYGLSSWGLSRDLKIPVEEAQNFIDAYFSRYPRVKEYIDEQIKSAKKNGFVATILGRRRFLPEINNKNQAIRQLAERQAVNTPIQGSASDLIKLAMIHISREIAKRGLKAMMVLQIHDELVFDLPLAELDGFVSLARNSMENVLKLDVPVKVSIKKGYNWLDMEEVK